jgi:predicted nucleotidyltransferase
MIDNPPSCSELLALLQAHQSELRAEGVEALSLFGSVARGDAVSGSDVDLVIRAGAGFSAGGFDHFGRLEALRERLAALLRRGVDLVEESALSPRMREVIRREGVRAF